jgi:hypothetical protein
MTAVIRTVQRPTAASLLNLIGRLREGEPEISITLKPCLRMEEHHGTSA